jgi:hypothetical protein
MKPSLVLRIFVSGACLASASVACSQEPEDATQSSDPLQVCLYDAACVDLPDAGLPPWPDAGFPPPPPPFDGGFSQPPPFPDAGFPGFDAGWPPAYGFDAASFAPLCNAFDPKYYAEYAQALGTLQVTPCSSCAAAECCYQGLACVAQ